MGKRPQIGVMYRREQDPSNLQEAARRAEELGFDQFWVVEDCFYLGGISQAAIALTATSSIKVGIGINPGVGHNAAILAMEYSTLERAFPGRFIGGIGHGLDVWMKQIGEKPASPLTALEEIATSMKRLLNGERITTQGRYVQLTDVQLDPPPAEAPPILLGVRGEKSMQLAGRIADGVLLAQRSGADYIRWSRNLMDESRTQPGTLGTLGITWVDDDDPAAARTKMREIVAAGLGNKLTASTANLSYTAELKELMDKGGADALVESMPDAWIRDLAVSGSVEEGRSTIQAWADAGADIVILSPLPDWNWMEWMEASAALLV